MLLRGSGEVARAETLRRLIFGNPFSGERLADERKLLGARFLPTGPNWSLRGSGGGDGRTPLDPATLDGDRPNLPAVTALADELALAVQSRLAAGECPDDEERSLVEAIVLHHLYYKYRAKLLPLVTTGASPAALFYGDVVSDAARFQPRGAAPLVEDLPHTFACFFQLLRAFVNVYTQFVGSSAPMASLRAEVWRSIFTRDLDAYRRGLHERLADISTLVLGPTGTGKELVARAIALSRYVPFDARARRFAAEPGTIFVAVNLAALSPTLIEAELFGHRRGTFTGAHADRTGFLEDCSASGVIFLDEIGELDGALQVKLLRVLQERVFQRIGETKPRRFLGKIVAATNRDLAAEMATGHFRPDLYYRLCADVITTPRLVQQLGDHPGDLRDMVRFIAERVATPALAPELAVEAVAFIQRALPRGYEWPGNFRELEQCVRNIMVRGTYRPNGQRPSGAVEEFVEGIRSGKLSADEVAGRYATLVFHKAGSLREAARRLGSDVRTVKARLDRAFLAKLA